MLPDRFTRKKFFVHAFEYLVAFEYLIIGYRGNQPLPDRLYGGDPADLIGCLFEKVPDRFIRPAYVSPPRYSPADGGVISVMGRTCRHIALIQ